MSKLFNNMLRNYFKTTLRSLRKHRPFSLINIFGLSIGLTAALFIFQYTYFQLSFDKFHDKGAQIYRVMNNRFEGDKLIQSGQITYSAVGPQLAEDFPEVIMSTTVNFFGNITLSYGGNIFNIGAAPLVEPSFFELFSYPFKYAGSDKLFENPQEIVLTHSMAQTLFGVEDVKLADKIGETIFFGSDRRPMKLVGILEDVPQNSSLSFDILISRETVMKFWGEQARFSWNGSDYFHYIQLREGVDQEEFEQKLSAFSDKYFRGDEVTSSFEEFHLQPLHDVHLNPDYEYENHITADGRMVWILVLTAFFILVMAWVNYVNLTTSKALQRAKEVGLRKVIGASKGQLILQFLIEALFLNLIAVILSFTCLQIGQGYFVELIDQPLALLDFLSGSIAGLPIWVLIIVLVLVGAILSGIYPAFILSQYKPSDTLKGSFAKKSEGVMLRKGLVLFQFVLSTILIGGTYLVIDQTNYMREKDLGANIDQVMTVKGPSVNSFDTTFVTQIAAFLQTLTQNSNVQAAGSSTADWGERLPRDFNIRLKGEQKGIMLNRMGVNYGFLSVYEIEMLAGRNFRASDHNRSWEALNAVILNEKAAKLFGFDDPEDAINKQLEIGSKSWNIVGVIQDFHQRSLRETIEPLMLLPLYEGGDDTYHIRLNTTDLESTISYVADVYDQFYPGDLFEYSFTDQEFENFYRSDRQFGQIFNIFSLVAISISCLGLFGLVGFTALQKTKEIGIRKVLGASVLDILRLLSQEFLGLVLIANVIGLPILYWAGQKWLQGFAYQTAMDFSVFIVPVMLVFVIAIVIILSQTIKTASENPVKSLHQD
jgi:putative ABC transport system permease protein